MCVDGGVVRSLIASCPRADENGTMVACGVAQKLHWVVSRRHLARGVRCHISANSFGYRGLASMEVPGRGISGKILLARRRGIAWALSHNRRIGSGFSCCDDALRKIWADVMNSVLMLVRSVCVLLRAIDGGTVGVSGLRRRCLMKSWTGVHSRTLLPKPYACRSAGCDGKDESYVVRCYCVVSDYSAGFDASDSLTVVSRPDSAGSWRRSGDAENVGTRSESV